MEGRGDGRGRHQGQGQTLDADRSPVINQNQQDPQASIATALNRLVDFFERIAGPQGPGPAHHMGHPEDKKDSPHDVTTRNNAEITIRDKSPARSARQGNPSRASQIDCHFCGKLGHKEKECWKKAGKCLRCGAEGHQIAHCPRIQGGPAAIPISDPRRALERAQQGKHIGNLRHTFQVRKHGTPGISSKEASENKAPPAKLKRKAEGTSSPGGGGKEMIETSTPPAKIGRQGASMHSPDGDKGVEVGPHEVTSQGGIHMDAPGKDRGQSTSQRSPSIAPRPKCYYCGKPGHRKKDCWAKTGKCIRCGAADHKIADCPRMQGRKEEIGKMFEMWGGGSPVCQLP